MKSRWNLAGKIKTLPEDFVVEEIPLYEPCGEGEHLYITVRKTNMSHDACLRHIANQFGVSKRDVGCAGRKDFHAVTTQMFSVYLRGKKPEVSDSIENVEVIASSYHGNKLRLGHLVGNKFVIRIREIESFSLQEVEQRLRIVSQAGMPNYFGPQRFGNYGTNHELGLALVLDDWDGLVSSLLGGDERHHAFVQEGEYKRAFDAWPFGQPAERNVLEALVAGKTSQQACKTIQRELQKLWVNALQSYLFNEVLASRMSDGTWDKLVRGDLAWKHDGGGRTFEVTEEELIDETIKERIEAFSLSASGPLWGAKMRMPSGRVLQKEIEVRELHGLAEAHLENMRKFALGARRPLRVQVVNPTISQLEDAHGPFFKLEFALPAGSYATTLIQQILEPTFNFSK
jgi:tRNA pseudouridine13 synthase